jgi:nicotinamide phosphoribosyltransferase
VKILTGYTADEIVWGTELGTNVRVPFCKETQKELQECEIKGAVEVLWDIFGGTETEQGYKVLDQHVGLIYGDSITLERAEQIMQRLADKGFASCNTVLGIGSYTYQYNTRDTFGFAMKATWGQVNGQAREIFKDPKTDDGLKKSARGLMRVEYEHGEYVLYDQQESDEGGELKIVFENSKLIKVQTLAQIRERILNA